MATVPDRHPFGIAVVGYTGGPVALQITRSGEASVVGFGSEVTGVGEVQDTAATDSRTLGLFRVREIRWLPEHVCGCPRERSAWANSGSECLQMPPGLRRMAPASGSPLAAAGDDAGPRNVTLVSIDFPVSIARPVHPRRLTPTLGPGTSCLIEPGLLAPGPRLSYPMTYSGTST
jgi:hypothetical protein